MQAKKVGNIPFAKQGGKSDKSAMAINELRQRVERRLRELDLGPIEAAEAVPGLERNYIRDLLQGKKESFNQAKLPQVAQALQWTVSDLLGDKEPKKERGSPRFQRVPLLDTVTAGKLKAPSSQIPLEDVPLLAFADLGRGEWFALKVESDADSMDRVSPEGSVIIVNRADKTLVTGKFYVFAVKGKTTFKMWPGGSNNYLEPYSTNPANKPVFYKKNELEVIGRVKRTVLDL